eukprot:6567876-Prymnesium_polylepis.2
MAAVYAKHLSVEERARLGDAAHGLSGRDILDICRQAERRWVCSLLRDGAPDALPGPPPPLPLPPLHEYEAALRHRLESSSGREDGAGGAGRPAAASKQPGTFRARDWSTRELATARELRGSKARRGAPPPAHERWPDLIARQRICRAAGADVGLSRTAKVHRKRETGVARLACPCGVSCAQAIPSDEPAMSGKAAGHGLSSDPTGMHERH